MLIYKKWEGQREAQRAQNRLKASLFVYFRYGLNKHYPSQLIFSTSNPSQIRRPHVNQASVTRNDKAVTLKGRWGKDILLLCFLVSSNGMNRPCPKRGPSLIDPLPKLKFNVTWTHLSTYECRKGKTQMTINCRDLLRDFVQRMKICTVALPTWKFQFARSCVQANYEADLLVG